MASSTKLSDNEMNYYQSKAKKMLLRKKEEKEWQDFCKEVAPDCAACLAEKVEVKESKDVEIQTFPQKPLLRTDRTPLQSKYQRKESPEAIINIADHNTPLQSKYQRLENPKALINIATRLEKIDLALSNLTDTYEQMYQQHVPSVRKPFTPERSHITATPTFPSQQAVKTFEEDRKLRIQNAFRTSLQNSASVIHKKAPVIKPKHSSFFLPHDLEVKRAAARKAYLASLQTKPKVTFQSKRPSSCEKPKNTQSKKSVPSRKKIFPKKENQKLKENSEETLIEAFVAEDTKDENIEFIVDAIFDDLLGEAALDLNRIRQRKREKCAAQSEVADNSKKSFVSFNPSTSSSAQHDSLNFAANDNNGIMKLKSFIDSFDVVHRKKYVRKEQVELEDKSTSTPNIQDSKVVDTKRIVTNSNFQSEQQVPRVAPKFVCGVKSIIKIDPKTAKDIAFKRNRFWRYLESISQIAKGDFNPWILNETLAESILDDCINDIAEELSEIPSSIIQGLYNQEFAQQVEI